MEKHGLTDSRNALSAMIKDATEKGNVVDFTYWNPFGVKREDLEGIKNTVRGKQGVAAFAPFVAAISNPDSLSKADADFGVRVLTAAAEVAAADADAATAALNNFARFAGLPRSLAEFNMCPEIQGVRPQIILFGDSITQQSFSLNGWGSSLADNFSRKADILNRGYDCYTTRWALFLLHHIFPLGSATPPVGVTIFFGVTDALLSESYHVRIEEYRENLRQMVHHLKECSPSMVVVLITPPPIDDDSRMAYARSYGDKARTQPERRFVITKEYATSCVSVAKELGVPCVNLWSKMHETKGWQRKYLRDGLNLLTPEGNAVVYKEVLQVFKQAGLSASVMPWDFPHHSKIDPRNPEKAFSTRSSQ